ncbi:phage protein [Buttiauxella gaviniae ATCC 51604]|uniref:Phage protein n=1 Tax=Buttiauxella gaviniae ATCC 51604 TaxID=1354253 RepID=A0A1B7HM85_9ENTR|nr:hypothetical protein [Buttiauxella gaviniae]OAT16767.1 phage protein [Buttiauxella gaviniae ATCC 51604]
MFKFGLNQLVEIAVSGEMGHIKGRGEYSNHINGYYVHYKAGDGRAVTSWFDENDIIAVEDKASGGQPIFVVDAPEAAAVKQ